MRKALKLSVLLGVSYNIARGFTSNSEENPINSKNQFKYGFHMIPHPKKVAKGGEDAYFVSNGLLAIADGVGGWGEMGIDPGLFSKELCLNIGQLWTKDNSLYYKKPKILIIEALKLTKNIGTSTCCLLAIDPKDPLLRTANIGDSGYLLYRKEGERLKCYYESPEHQRSFNFPYQIGTNGDNPEISIEKTHELINSGDLVILGTDGLLDNLALEEMDEILNRNKNVLLGDLNVMVKELAEKAFENSRNRKKTSPFERKAKAAGLLHSGGKPDDITVVVAVIDLKKK